jgi:hypothetical protein
MYRSDDAVLLVATSGVDELVFREGDLGVFGSIGRHRVGLVLDVEPPDTIALAWWWPDASGTLRQQSRAELSRCRALVPPPAVDVVAERPDPGAAAAGPAPGSPVEVPWPGILVLDGPRAGIVAQQLAERLTRAAVVRTDLFDQAVRGGQAAPDPAVRERVAVAVVRAYAEAGLPVLLHGRGGSAVQRALVGALADAGLRPVRLVEVADGEGYGEVARRLIQGE